MKIYAVRTTSGQEKTVAAFIASRAAAKKLPIASVLAPETIRGYIFVEAAASHVVDEAIAGIKHAHGRTRGEIPLSEMDKFLISKPIIEELKTNDVVEIIAGPFKGLRAKITNVDKIKDEITIELLEEGFSILPITVHADYVKLVEKGSGGDAGEKSY